MLLMFQIAGGIILAILLLQLFGAVGQSYAAWKERRAEQKAFDGRVREAEEAGWRWDQASFSSYEEQLSSYEE